MSTTRASLPSNDARECVGEQHELELSHALRVPITVDGTGWLRDGIELLYRRRANEFLPTRVKVGRETLLRDVQAIGDVYLHFAKYNSALYRLRQLELGDAERVRIQRRIEARQLQYMGLGTVRFHTLVEETKYLDALAAKCRGRDGSLPQSTSAEQGPSEFPLCL